MADDNLDKWMKALRGTPDADADGREASRAEAVRQYFLRRIAEDGEAAPAAADRRDRLLAYLRRKEGMPTDLARAPATPETVAPPERRKASNARWFALVAGIAAIVATIPLINLLQRPDGAEPGADEALQLRGGAPMQTVHTASPARTAEEIERHLMKLGAMVRREGFEEESVTISARIAPEQIGEARSALADFGIKVGDDGRLRVMLLP
jgi:hypothetical protein